MRTFSPPPIEAAAAGFILVGAAASLKIGLANSLLAIGFLLWFAALARRRARIVFHPILYPVAAWVVWSFVSTAMSPDPVFSLRSLDGLLTLFIVPALLSVLTLERWDRFVFGLGVVSTASSLIALGQIAVNGVDLNHRAAGVFSHYMTFAGWTMAVVLILLGEVLKGRDRSRLRWIVPMLLLHAVVLALSLTRNAWIGLAAAIGLAAIWWRSRLLLAIPMAAVVAVAVLPGAVRSRVISIADLSQPANRDRLAMIAAGQAMIEDRPLAGVGPDRIQVAYPTYRRPDAVRPRVSHLHCNPITIAAERGLPALLIYLWWLAAAGVTIVRGLRVEDNPAAAALTSCLLALVGLSTAGLFEFNWGDAEVWILTLVVLTVPAALTRRAPATLRGDGAP